MKAVWYYAQKIIGRIINRQNNLFLCLLPMPTTIKPAIKQIDDDEFHEIDYQVTGLAYKIHNEIGRLWDEKIYQTELANRCRASGFKSILTEVPLVVSYKDFRKEYFIDLLVENAIIYELKAVNRLTSEHEKQTLNYLFLLGAQHGKLINFRPTSVQRRFVSTTLFQDNRYDLVFDDRLWYEFDDNSISLKQLIMDLLKDWGAYLETNLFYEAIYHFRGGEHQVVKNVNIVRNGMKLGNQKMHLLNDQVAFELSAITKGVDLYEAHLRKFLYLTDLNAIQWINFNHNIISFKTISNNHSAG